MSRHSITNPAQRIALTDRQEDVLKLVSRGLTNAEIAERLGVTLDGVKWHIREILGKFGVESREQAVARWREENGVTQRARHWAGALWGSLALRWGGGLVVAGAGAAAGVALFVEAPADGDSRLQVPAVVTPADPATADGLTLKIEKVEADDTQTTITLSLTGRPELGRMSGPAQGIMLDKATGRLAGPPLTITDELGNSYHLRSWQALQPDFRTVRMTVDPMVASATSLTLQMSGQPFVAPAAETKEGERPPDPSAVIGGPWQATASEIQRSAVQSYPLALPSIPVAEGTFVPLAVVQTPNGTILRFRTEGIDPGRGVNFFPWATLIDATGAKVAGANVGAGWGNPADPEILEYGFASIHGQVTLSLDVTISHPKDVTGFLYCLDSDKAPCPTDEQIAAQRERDEAAAEDLEALIATQPKATWSFAIP